jgi:hypothetical protein
MPQSATKERARKAAPRFGVALDRSARAMPPAPLPRGAEKLWRPRGAPPNPIDPVAPAAGAPASLPKPQRHRLSRVIVAISALIMIVASGLIAPRIVPPIVHAMAHALFPPAQDTVPGLAPAEPAATIVAPQASTSLGIGATQSYNGLAITVSDLRLQSSSGPVGAPSRSVFAIVRVNILNLDLGQMAPYSAGDFVLVDAAGREQRQTFAALVDPLGAGDIAPGGDVTGELAFLVPAMPVPGASSLVIVWLPSVQAGNTPLSWSL